MQTSSAFRNDSAPCRTIAAYKRPADGIVIYQFRLDDAARIVRGAARGCWTIEETDRYLADLDSFVAASRLTFGKVRVLLDRREVSDQSPDVRARLAIGNRDIFRDDDRIALVVDSSLMKASLRQRMPHSGTKAFLSISAAETWLSA